MVPFDEFMNQSIAAPRQPKPTKIPAPVLENLKSAGILPATWPESPSLAEVASSLLKKINEMHRLQVGDPAASRAEKRLSLQNAGNAFLTVLALAGSFPDPIEE